MNKIFQYFACATIALTMAGCATPTITPTYLSSDLELMRIGSEQPKNNEAVVVNMGSYCMQTVERWKADGKTPDGQTIWTKDSLRNVALCH
jgi:hypothetical protein